MSRWGCKARKIFDLLSVISIFSGKIMYRRQRKRRTHIYCQILNRLKKLSKIGSSIEVKLIFHVYLFELFLILLGFIIFHCTWHYTTCDSFKVAQLVEHWTVMQEVASSTPAGPPLSVVK